MKRPLLQKENRVHRTYRGGRLLDGFLGKADAKDTFLPEDWISSFVEAKNRNYIKGEGISTVTVDGRTLPITEAITEEDFGPDRRESGVLVKLLNSAERLGIQVHPTPEFSQKYFGTHYGKTECWHILETDPDADAAVYIGFREGVTRAKWAKLFEKQDIAGMLDCLHRFEVKAGDTVLVRAGTPHAIGAGVFLLEIQEPTDYTMRVEKTTLAGEKLTEHQIHYGVGENALLDCFIYKGLSREAAQKAYFLPARERAEGASGEYLTLVSYADTPCFALDRIEGGAVTLVPDCFVTLVVTKEGRITVGDEELTVLRGDKLFVPYGCGAIRVQGAGALVCYPPEIK